jgi:hypothetical protein
MPWFKIDDTLHNHPKARKAGLAAVGLFTVGGSFCMAYKTDGFVPKWYVLSWPQGLKLANYLVTAGVPAGFWEPVIKNGEEGWLVHDWEDYQPSADEIESDRKNARERQRKRRAKLRAARNGTSDET